MSSGAVLINHALIQGAFQIPVLVRQVSNNNPGTATSWTANIVNAPVQGNLQIFTWGGLQNRTHNAPSGGGWTARQQLGTPGSLEVWSRIAPAAAPSSYTLSWSGGNLQGSWSYFEVANCEDTLCNYEVNLDTGVPRLSAAFPLYTVLQPGFAVSSCIQIGGGFTWTPNNSFIVAAAASARYTTYYRNYVSPAVNESTTWSGPSGRTTLGLTIFKATFV